MSTLLSGVTRADIEYTLDLAIPGARATTCTLLATPESPKQQA